MSATPFRKRSLDRLSSPDRLDELLRVARPPAWLPLITLGGLIAAAAAWSALGSLPVRVDGRGLLLHPSHVVSVESPWRGQLVSLAVEVGDEVERGDELGTVDQAQVLMKLQQARAKAERLEKTITRGSTLRTDRIEDERGSITARRESLAEQIERAKAVQRQVGRTLRRSLEEDVVRLGAQLETARALHRLQLGQLEELRKLAADGIESSATLLESEQAALDADMRVRTLEADLAGARRKLIELEESELERSRRLAELESELRELGVKEHRLGEEELEHSSDDRDELAVLRDEIARLELQLRRESRVVSPVDGRILELHAAPGQMLSEGATIGTIQAPRPGSPLVALSYFTVKHGKRLREGMAAQVTPDTVERERFGSLRGEVRRVSPYPVTRAEAERLVGNPELAEQLTKGGNLMQVQVELEPDGETPSGYAWTSSRGPSQALTPGVTTSVRVVVERRSPISFVLPVLRSGAGLE